MSERHGKVTARPGGIRRRLSMALRSTLLAGMAIGRLALASPPVAPPLERPSLADRLVPALATALNERYIFPEKAQLVGKALLDRLRRGDYRAHTTPAALADALTRDLRDLAADKHLAVAYRPEADEVVAAARSDAEEKAEENARKVHGRRAHFGFRSVEILPGNVGYLDLRGFYRPNEVSEAAPAALAFLADTDAVVLDLRQNLGGNPGTVALLAGAFFREPVHLFDQVRREGNETVASWTAPSAVSPRLAAPPLFVLTSKTTFSAGEGLAYALQKLGRARVVGERSAGAAHSGRFERLDRDFVAFIPNGRIVIPSTGTDWEGAGVIPDLEIAPDKALDAAHLLALRAARSKPADAAWTSELDTAIRTLEARLGESAAKVRAFPAR